MSLQEKVAGVGEVAATLGRTEDWLRRNWLKLHLEHGMPRKMAVGWVWPRGAMERWIENNGEPYRAPQADDVSAGMGAVVANQNERLRRRYASTRT